MSGTCKTGEHMRAGKEISKLVRKLEDLGIKRTPQKVSSHFEYLD